MHHRCKDDGSNALHYAASQNEPDNKLALECAEILLRAGADPNVKTEGYGVTLLSRAAANGQSGMVKVSLVPKHE